MKNYKIKKRQLFIKDWASVSFHVENNDYFGTAANLISLTKDLLQDSLDSINTNDVQLIIQSLDLLQKDLVILQENYHIKANRVKVHKGAKGKLKSQ